MLFLFARFGEDLGLKSEKCLSPQKGTKRVKAVLAQISSSLFSYLQALPLPSPQVLTSPIFQEALIIPVSFPDVKGALTPTVTAAFIDTVSALWQVKKSTLTHKAFSINNRCRAGFLPFDIISQTDAFHFTNIPRK
jgi:hypothetical protein